MTRLILTNDAFRGLEEAGRADIAVPFVPRFVWGPLPSDAELAAMLAVRTTQKPGSHWLHCARQSTVKQIGWKDLGLNDLITATAEELGRWRVLDVDVTKDELETASMTWQAYRATTPEACFDLLGKDLSALPLLRPAWLDLLEELPSGSTGLGATEMRLLELIARGYCLTNALFHLRGLRQRRVFQGIGNRRAPRRARPRSNTGGGGPRRRTAHAQQG